MYYATFGSHTIILQTTFYLVLYNKYFNYHGNTLYLYYHSNKTFSIDSGLVFSK